MNAIIEMECKIDITMQDKEQKNKEWDQKFLRIEIIRKKLEKEKRHESKGKTR